jgi:hypothetical protein
MESGRWQTWQDAFDAEWKDEVDPPGGEAGDCSPFRDLVHEFRDFATTIADVTLTPLRMMVETVNVSDVIAGEHRHWRRAHRRWARVRRTSRW